MRIVILSLAAACAVDAFVQPSWLSLVTQRVPTSTPPLKQLTAPLTHGSRQWLCLRASVDESTEAVVDNEVATPDQVGATAEGENDAPAPESEGGESPEGEANDAVEGDEEEKEEVVEEDPEIVALKAELAAMEVEVKSARLALSTAKDRLSDTGETGFQRLAAKVQDFKMKAKDGSKGDKSRAMIKIATSFMPILDELEAAPSALPAQDDAQESLHKSYQALYRDLESKFATFGLEAFHAVIGEAFDESLHEAATGADADELLLQADTNAASGTVVAQVRTGQRLQGAVIRRALVVVVPAAVDDSGDEVEEGEGEGDAPTAPVVDEEKEAVGDGPAPPT